jgi:hypothetical protein
MAAISEGHPLYERLFMRAGFAFIVLASTPTVLNFRSVPAPNGFARLVDLSFLTNPQCLAVCRVVLLIALGLYLARLCLLLVMPVILLLHVSINALANSQGAIRHAAQIVSLVLLAQTAACYYEWWRGRKTATPPGALEERQIFWSQQAIVATYFVAGLTKLIATGGAWIFRARYIGVQIFKTAYQDYYNDLDSLGLDDQVAIAQFAAAHGTLVAAICALGLLLELSSPLILLGRWWSLVLGSCLLALHLSIASVMQLGFLFHRLLLVVYIISPIFWIVWGAGAVMRARGSPTSP